MTVNARLGGGFDINKQWLFPLVVSLHNSEEAIWLPQYWMRRGWHFLSTAQFRLAAASVAGLAWVITYHSVRGGQNSLSRRLFIVFCWVMLVNAFWHIAATLFIAAYAPGVVTAVLLVLPATSYLLLRSLHKT